MSDLSDEETDDPTHADRRNFYKVEKWARDGQRVVGSVMDDMPRPRPPHLHRQVTQHGKTVWYVRIGKGPRIRIRAAFGTPEFDAEYQAAIAGLPARQSAKDDRTSTGTLAWLVERYRETGAWTDLSLATRRQRENIFKQVLKTAGKQSIAKITTASIMAGRDRRQDTPARHFLDAMRGLFRWAVKAKLVASDPTVGVDNPPRPKTDGFAVWSDDDIAAYEKRWPIGTRQRVWLDVLVYTGLRRGDAVRFGRQHIRNGVGSIKTEKNDTPVTLPILRFYRRRLKPDLAAILPSLPARMVVSSPRSRSAIYSVRHAAQRGRTSVRS